MIKISPKIFISFANNMKAMKFPFYILLALIVLPFFTQAQETALDSIRKSKKYGIPIISYSPETSLRFGIVGIYLFRTNNKNLDTQLSSLRTPITYTINRQIKLGISYDIFLNENKHIFTGQAEWLSFPLSFWGVGSDTPDEAEELFTTETGNIQFSYFCLLKNSLYIGGQLNYINSVISEKETGGLLASDGSIPGNNGGASTGLGLSFRYDKRDNYLNASTGPFLEGTITYNRQAFGGDFDYTKLVLDGRHFFKVNGGHILAFQAFSEYNWGSPPFEQMALLGGKTIMRGHYLGRFRDNASGAVQAEYRLPLGRKTWLAGDDKLKFWQRWGLIGFFGLGNVGSTYADLFNGKWKYSMGVGVRVMILPEEQINFRLDFGFGTQTPGFYFNIREAF